MTSTEFAGQAAGVLERLDGVLDDLSSLDLTGGSDEELIELLVGVERRVRRFASVDHAVIAEAEVRGVAIRHGCSNMTAFVSRLLGIGSGQAVLRVRAARQLAPRRALSGEVLAPEFAATAAALGEGAISVAHAQTITATIRALPVVVREESFEQVEPQLAGYARQFGLDQFRLLARHLGDVLDPDGTLHDGKHRERQRAVNVKQRPDGSVSGTFEATAQFGEALLSLLDKFAAPRPESDGAKDPRTPGQRRHDGLLDAMTLLLRSDQVGDCHGVSTTIILTMTAEQAATGAGLARSGHGALVPVQDVLANIGDARIFPVVLGDHPPDTGPPDTTVSDLFAKARPVAAYGTTHRIFTEGQRLAMIARDQGCSFPGCTVAPGWCEAHHVTEWQLGRRTSVDDGALLCGWHHREFENLGWQGLMRDGIPHFVPPHWLDPDRTPQRNTAHDIAVA